MTLGLLPELQSRTSRVGAFLKRNSSYGLLLAFLLGVGLRLTLYGHNPSLDVDQLWVAAAVTAEHPKAVPTPSGFLWLTRVTVRTFGVGDHALRLVPMLSGVAALALAIPLSLRCCEPLGALLATLLLAISYWPIFYSVYLKQYSSDVAVAAGLWVIVLGAGGRDWSRRRFFLAGSAGMIAVWFSHPAVFVLAGTGLLLLGRSIFRRERKQTVALTVLCCLWLASFGLCYLITIRPVSINTGLVTYWSNHNAFPPPFGASQASILWYLRLPLELMQNPVGFISLPGLAAFAFLAGIVSMWHSRRAWEAMILLAPLAVAFLAAAFHRYPFQGRLLLFACPAILILIAEGAMLVWHATRRADVGALGAAFVLILVAYPAQDALREAAVPGQEDMRSVAQHVQAARRTSDALYVYYGAMPAWEYYHCGILNQWITAPDGTIVTVTMKDSMQAPAHQLAAQDYVRGGAHRDSFFKYLPEIEQFRGKDRVWFVISHGWKYDGIDEERLFLAYLDSAGRRLYSFKATGAGAYLYDLSGGTAGNPAKD